MQVFDIKKLTCFNDRWGNLCENHVNALNVLCTTTNQICKDYCEAQKQHEPLGFNVFTLVSDRYYLENYHSDILNAFLDPNGGHHENSLYLNLFIEMLGLAPQHYRGAMVIREESKIDILIKNNVTQRAIIIENKINNALDMINQLPRYYEKLTQEGYLVEKIVYIPLDNSKRPDSSSWNTDTKDKVMSLVTIIPAVAIKHDELSITKWIEKSILSSNNIDNISILRQYLKLIKFLRGRTMDYIIMEKFHAELLKNDTLQNAISISNMLHDLPNYLAYKIHARYSNRFSPFTKLWIYKSTDTVFEGYKFNGYEFKCDVWCEKDKYNVYFWEQNSNSICDIKNMFSSLDSLKNFSQERGINYSMEKVFSSNQ